MNFHLAPLPAEEIEAFLAQRKREWNSAQRSLVARLSGGGLGRALGFDVDAYTAARKNALTLLHTGVSSADHTTLFHVTETYRAEPTDATRPSNCYARCTRCSKT